MAAPRDLTPQNYLIDLLAIAGVSELAVPSAPGTSVYTKYFALPRNVDFGLLLKAASGGAVDIKVDLEQGNTVPTESAIDADGNWAVGQAVSAGIATTGVFLFALSPIVTQYARLKFTGQGVNAASSKFTKIQVALSKRF